MQDSDVNSNLTPIKKAIKAFKNVKSDLRKHGLKFTFKKYGWRLALAIFIYYLIRDSILYLLIPALIGYKLI